MRSSRSRYSSSCIQFRSRIRTQLVSSTSGRDELAAPLPGREGADAQELPEGRAVPRAVAGRLTRISGCEERSEAASDRCDDEDRPRLEENVDYLPSRRDGVLERGRDG